MTDPKQKLVIESESVRDLGLTSALAIGVGTMIAAGIFTLSGLAVRDVGSSAIIAFMLAAIVSLFTALAYCEFVSIYPQSGEGYLYSRKTFPAPLAYLAGWALILGYSSSCAFYIASMSSYFNEFIWEPPYHGLAGVVTLGALMLLNIKGTKESGHFQIIVTVAKIVLLIWFVVGGFSHVNMDQLAERFSRDVAKIGATAAMVFITFFGFSAIAASAGEVKNPVRTIPRAIFLSMAIVTLLYTLVVLVIVCAGLTEYSEAAMGVAARQFLGPIGGMVIVAGALFSMISASNASVMAGSRVVFSMSLLGHLPKRWGSISIRTRTPVIAILLIGAAILVFSTFLPLEDLAHFADTVLLLALILVNIALIQHRRKFPDMKRPFRVPLVPELPVIAILCNLYLLSQIMHHTLPIVLALSALVLGMVAFLIWKALQKQAVALPGADSHVALIRQTPTPGKYRVLVPLANPANVTRLMEIAAAIAAERDGEIVALRIALVPEQFPPALADRYVERERAILEHAHEEALKIGVPVTSLVRIGHSPARAILETADEHSCNLIVLGWKGYAGTHAHILGEVTDTVITHARTDIMLVEQGDQQAPRNFLLPTAGGEHSRLAEQYIAAMIRAHGGTVQVCGIAAPDAASADVSAVEERLAQVIGRLSNDGVTSATTCVVRNSSVVRGILDEAARCDAVIMGAAGRGLLPHVLFGNIPETIARESPCPVFVVKRYRPAKALFGRVMRE